VGFVLLNLMLDWGFCGVCAAQSYVVVGFCWGLCCAMLCCSEVLVGFVLLNLMLQWGFSGVCVAQSYVVVGF
jgi:hypothetical protein